MSANYNHSNEFIQNLLKEVEKSLANKINKENSNRKFDLGLNPCTNYSQLVAYRDILMAILNCSSCDLGYTTDEIISLVKNKLNALS